MARPSATSRLASQVAELRKLVEAHIAATRPHVCLRIIYREGTSEHEIARLRAATAAAAGLDSPSDIAWIDRVIITPPPCVKVPGLTTGPSLDKAAHALVIGYPDG